MSVPGMNVLAAALSLIAPQTVDYFEYIGREVDGAGKWVPLYAVGTPVRGSFQPIDEVRAQLLGLDVTKRWAVFRAPRAVISVSRGDAGDQLEFFGRRYQVKGTTDWMAQDGWTALTCVDITDP